MNGEQVKEFKMMVKELHKAGIEVILDVVYNHTAEGNHHGPTLSFRGIDLLLSQGVPMITAGDEMGRPQQGNNNAYCQDNEIGWVHWAQGRIFNGVTSCAPKYGYIICKGDPL